MFKKWKELLLLISMLLLSVITANAFDVYVDGQKVEFNDNTGYPYIDNDRTMLPLRAVTEACGAEGVCKRFRSGSGDGSRGGI
jgi:hypothetical protein